MGGHFAYSQSFEERSEYIIYVPFDNILLDNLWLHSLEFCLYSWVCIQYCGMYIQFLMELSATADH